MLDLGDPTLYRHLHPEPDAEPPSAFGQFRIESSYTVQPGTIVFRTEPLQDQSGYQMSAKSIADAFNIPLKMIAPAEPTDDIEAVQTALDKANQPVPSIGIPPGYEPKGRLGDRSDYTQIDETYGAFIQTPPRGLFQQISSSTTSLPMSRYYDAVVKANNTLSEIVPGWGDPIREPSRCVSMNDFLADFPDEKLSLTVKLWQPICETDAYAKFRGVVQAATALIRTKAGDWRSRADRSTAYPVLDEQMRWNLRAQPAMFYPQLSGTPNIVRWARGLPTGLEQLKRAYPPKAKS